MCPTFNAGSEFLEPLLQALKSRGFDHSAHLREHPDETAGFGVVELLIAGCAVYPCCLGDQASEAIQGVPDERTLAAILALIVYGGGLSDFVFLGQAVGPFSLVNSGSRLALQIPRDPMRLSRRSTSPVIPDAKRSSRFKLSVCSRA
jgi:hypothetical protein